MLNKTIESVLVENANNLMSLHGVVGTAIGNHEGKPCIKVYINKKTPKLLRQIPSALDQYVVVVEESGEFRALNK